MTMSSIDNPPTNIIDDDNANDMNIRTRKRSREILLDHVCIVCKKLDEVIFDFLLFFFIKKSKLGILKQIYFPI